MFTGIISATGRVCRLSAASGGARLFLEPSQPINDLATGESIAVSGVCLTVEADSTPGELQFFLSQETLDRTRLGRLEPDATVNLERSLRPDDRLGGHLVMGHVDAVGTLRRLESLGEGWLLEVEFPAALAPFIAPKGSISVDGISLTVTSLRENAFAAALIPHTVEATSLSAAKAGDPVNLEADMLARYVVRALEAMTARGSGGVTEALLIRAGFINPA